MPKVEFLNKFAGMNDRDNLVFHFTEEISLDVIQWHKSQFERYFKISSTGIEQTLTWNLLGMTI